jgi:hypothetical protein
MKMRIKRFIELALVGLWLGLSTHFLLAHTKNTLLWEHYVLEGFFLFCFSVFTWLWFKVCDRD